jgi:hypothetical protein
MKGFWSTLCACSLLALHCSGCGGKGSSNHVSSSAGSSGSPHGGSSAQAGSGAAAGSSSGAVGGSGGQSGGGDGEADTEAGLPCVKDPLMRQAPCQTGGEHALPGPRPFCPDTEPGLGDTCDNPGLLCSYGDAVTPTCRKYYACAENEWRLDPHIDAERYPCDEPAAGYCPAEPPPYHTSCTPVPGRAPCVYADVLCACVSGHHWAAGTDEWLCYGPPRDPNCPRSLPNIGEGCSTPGVQCSYIEDCELPPYSTVFCRNGVWEEGERSTPCQL